MCHSLFIMSLIELEIMTSLLKSLTDSDNAAVTENADKKPATNDTVLTPVSEKPPSITSSTVSGSKYSLSLVV